MHTSTKTRNSILMLITKTIIKIFGNLHAISYSKSYHKDNMYYVTIDNNVLWSARRIDRIKRQNICIIVLSNIRSTSS